MNTYHPLSSPLLRKPHSPFPTQSQPPPTPLPIRQSGTSLALIVLEDDEEEDKAEPPLLLLTNVLKLATNGLKSSVDESSGILPVSARPMAINGAACVHIIIALLSFACCGFFLSNSASSASTSAIIASRAVAIRSWSSEIVSPCGLGMMCGV